MAISGGKVIVKIDGDDKGFKNAISKAGSIAKKSLGVAVTGAAAVGTAFTGATVAALKFSGEIEQNIGGSKQVFKDFATTIQTEADKAFKNMGLSASDFLANANKMGALLQGSGFGIKESGEMAINVMQRASDVASIMGIDVSAAMEAVTGAAKGNFTMMDNLGVAMNATTIEAYALSKGIKTNYADMENYQKVSLAMEMFLEKTAYATGNYAKENDTLAGSLTTAKAALENFVAGTGTVEDIVESLTNASRVILKNLGELLPHLTEGLEEIVGELIPVLPEIIRQLFPAVISTFRELLDTLINMLPELVTAISTSIGEAVPLIKPLTNILSTVANNLDVLATAATSAVAAFSAFAIVSKITALVSGYSTAALGLQSALALASVKTKLLTAAQVALNTVMNANPIAIVVAALAALTAGVVTYTATHKSAADEIRKAHEDAIKAIDDNTSSELAQAEVANQLRNRLFELEKQINSGTLSDEESAKVKDEFNGVANQLNDIIPDIINNIYDENGAMAVQKGKVDALTNSYIALTKAKAMSAAYESKIKASTETLIDLQKTAADLEAKGAGTPRKASNIFSLLGQYAEDNTYKSTLQQIDKVEAEIDGYISEMGKYQNEITSLMGDAGEKGGDKLSGGISKGVSKATKAVKDGAKEQSEILEEQYKKELRDLQYLRDMEEITDEQYYEALAEYRDKYFDEGSEDWQNYTVEIYRYQKETQEKMLDEAEKAANELADTFTEKADALLSAKNALKDNLSDLADGISTITYRGLGEHGEDIVDTIISPDELKKANDLKEAFAESAQAARDRVFAALGDENKELAQEIYNQIREMGVEEGLAFSNAINQANDSKFDAWIAEKKRGFNLDESTANELYQDEIDELEDFKQKIIDKFGELPENFFDIGTDTAEQFGSGFMDKIREVMENARQQVIASMSNIAALPAVVSKISGTGTVTYNSNSSTYYVQPAQGESTQAQLAAIRSAETVSKMRGGY